MGKKDIIGGSLWDNYSDKVVQRMNNPKYLGEINEDEAKELGGRLIIADWGAESCGDAVRLYWVVDPEDVIIKAAFQSFGCGTAIASSDIMAELCVGKKADEAVKITNIDVERALRDDPETSAVPPQKMHCSVMAYDVIKQAYAQLKGIDTKDLEDSKMVCDCGQVTLGTIEDAIRVNDLHTVEEITHYTKAGGFCRSCIQPGGHEEKPYYLVDILRRVRAEMGAEKGEETPFQELGLFKKSRMIEQCIEAMVRPMLKSDGGDIDILDVYDEEGQTVVKIRFKGACAGCAGALGKTFDGIGKILRRDVDESVLIKT